ncbi:hypothetical protein [Corynebacterium efficiens]|uniref:Uncharacterized protein n=1 Tax=Corynebacterium efficiens (strain DSM 44549 / YS-314 / AJ 12310 / JCM 11189 / NBRC 100395) TaxID=196164 RepID=Q8FTC5_COREF|nr:hypothetical protein [Corynebacterium efficiens]BAC18454.1 hypothetical protein [Corynebacterium efficiens YS-314]
MSAASGKSRLKLDMDNRMAWRKVPAGIRIGGAFVALGAVMIVFGVIELFSGGLLQPFAVTPRFLVILLAAAILGGFATVSKYENSSRLQVIALAVAVILVFASRALPNDPIMLIEQFWLSLWAVTAIICGLIIRRSLMPKA